MFIVVEHIPTGRSGYIVSGPVIEQGQAHVVVIFFETGLFELLSVEDVRTPVEEGDTGEEDQLVRNVVSLVPNKDDETTH